MSQEKDNTVTGEQRTRATPWCQIHRGGQSILQPRTSAEQERRQHETLSSCRRQDPDELS